MVDSIGIALLAAGKGTRMKFDGPKVLVPLLGRPLIDYVLDATADFSQKVQVSSHTGVVIGHEKEKVQAHIQEAYSKRTDISFAVQEQQKGTADALKSYFQGTSKAWDKDLTLVVCGDTPLLTSEIFCDLYERLKANSELQGVAATFTAAKPTGYGRIQREDVGFKIIEQKDANEEQKLIKEVNSGLYLLKTEFIKKNLEGIDNDNNSGEFYLTDLFQPHFQVQAIEFEDAKCFQGVNNLTQLQQAEETLRKKKIKNLQGLGVIFKDPSSCYLDWGIEIGAGSIIYPQVCLEGETIIEQDTLIEMGTVIKNSRVNQGAKIYAHSYLESAIVGSKANIGPFARLRPDANIGEECKVGNFVEVKKATLKAGSKVSHLSYVGDAEIGEKSNIGCGFISCNYDGKNKHKTIIGKNTFVGSDVQAVAPVKIGDNALIAAGSTITQDVPDEGFAVARSKQVTKEKMAKRFPPFKD